VVVSDNLRETVVWRVSNGMFTALDTFQTITAIITGHDSAGSVTVPIIRVRVSALRYNPFRSSRVVHMLDGLQERRCSGGVSVPKVPPLEALRLRFTSPNNRALPDCDAPRPQKLSRGPRSLRPRCSHSLPWYAILTTLSLFYSRSFSEAFVVIFYFSRSRC